MKPDSTKIMPDTSHVVAGVFTEIKNAKDAICDLSKAGFSPSQINVAFAQGSPANSHSSELANTEHSLPWKLKESFEHDLYRQGAEQIAGENGESSLRRDSKYTEVDLRQALSEIGVADDRIKLLNDEIRNGVLMLVNAGDFLNKAHEIIERNNGTIRTDTATEPAPKIA